MTFLDTLRHFGFPEEIEGELYFHPVAPKCAVCEVRVFDSESVRIGACGPCRIRFEITDVLPPSRRDSASHIPGPGELPGEGT